MKPRAAPRVRRRAGAPFGRELPAKYGKCSKYAKYGKYSEYGVYGESMANALLITTHELKTISRRHLSEQVCASCRGGNGQQRHLPPEDI
jgi:hypothetical protein